MLHVDKGQFLPTPERLKEIVNSSKKLLEDISDEELETFSECTEELNKS